MYKEGIISFFYLIEMGYFEPLSGFEEHFISGISPNANLDFLDASIVYLREAVFRPIVERLQQGSGHIIVGSNIDVGGSKLFIKSRKNQDLMFRIRTCMRLFLLLDC